MTRKKNADTFDRTTKTRGKESETISVLHTMKSFFAVLLALCVSASVGSDEMACRNNDIYFVIDKSLSISEADADCVAQHGKSCFNIIEDWVEEVYNAVVEKHSENAATCQGARVSLYTFNNIENLVTPLTNNGDLIASGFNFLSKHVKVTGGTNPHAVFKAIDEAMDAVENPGNNNLVFITDGRSEGRKPIVDKTAYGGYKRVNCGQCVWTGTGANYLKDGTYYCVRDDMAIYEKNTDAECVKLGQMKAYLRGDAVRSAKVLRKQHKTNFISVGIGSNVKLSELKEITGNKDQVFLSSDISSMEPIIDIIAPWLAKTGAPTVPPTTKEPTTRRPTNPPTTRKPTTPRPTNPPTTKEPTGIVSSPPVTAEPTAAPSEESKSLWWIGLIAGVAVIGTGLEYNRRSKLPSRRADMGMSDKASFGSGSGADEALAIEAEEENEVAVIDDDKNDDLL